MTNNNNEGAHTAAPEGKFALLPAGSGWEAQMQRAARTTPKPPRISTPIKTAIIYLLLAGLWIILTDYFLRVEVHDDDVFIGLLLYKNWLFVVATSLLLFFLIKRDMTEIQRSQAALHALSMRDELTGLYNRRGFTTLLEHTLHVAHRLGTGGFLLYADLDGMKAVNDTYGHAMGDRMLADVAAILRRTFRESDITGRMGGDEFAVIIPNAPPPAVETIIERLRENIEAFNARPNVPYTISLSVGIVKYEPRDRSAAADLIARADKAMYEEKSRKKQLAACT